MDLFATRWVWDGYELGWVVSKVNLQSHCEQGRNSEDKYFQFPIYAMIKLLKILSLFSHQARPYVCLCVFCEIKLKSIFSHPIFSIIWNNYNIPTQYNTHVAGGISIFHLNQPKLLKTNKPLTHSLRKHSLETVSMLWLPSSHIPKTLTGEPRCVRKYSKENALKNLILIEIK